MPCFPFAVREMFPGPLSGTSTLPPPFLANVFVKVSTFFARRAFLSVRVAMVMVRESLDFISSYNTSLPVTATPPGCQNNLLSLPRWPGWGIQLKVPSPRQHRQAPRRQIVPPPFLQPGFGWSSSCLLFCRVSTTSSTIWRPFQNPPSPHWPGESVLTIAWPSWPPS